MFLLLSFYSCLSSLNNLLFFYFSISFYLSISDVLICNSLFTIHYSFQYMFLFIFKYFSIPSSFRNINFLLIRYFFLYFLPLNPFFVWKYISITNCFPLFFLFGVSKYLFLSLPILPFLSHYLPLNLFLSPTCIFSSHYYLLFTPVVTPILKYPTVR
jgi:hypothetical protein